MSSPLRDPKSLAEWLELDYFRRPRRLRLFKRRTGWLILLLASAALLALTFWPRSPLIYQAGPVSPAHTMFGHDCQLCHTQALQPLWRLWHSSEAYRSVPDSACLHCHDGPPHHAHAQVATAPCAVCHQEHRGQAQLARVPDSHCTACHQDLQTPGGASRFEKTITSFTTDHPPFGKWRGVELTDPGTIQFNHKVHLGLDPEAVRGIDRPLAELRQRGCAYCHETSRPLADGKSQTDPNRRYLLPIRYDKHCAACHPLGVQVAGTWQDPKIQQAAERFRQKPAPHPGPGETAAEVRAVLRERFLAFAQETGVLGQPESTAPERPIPGARRGRPVTDKEHEWASQQLRFAERTLFEGKSGCGYCHQETTAPERRPNGLPQYAAPNLLARWFPHSRFSHASHRLLACTECHAAPASTSTSDVLMPPLETCRKCHQPAVGARTDCVECHLYHDRGRDRGLNGPLTIPDAAKR